MITDIALVAAGYVVGSIPAAYVIPRLVRGEDIRTKGSGNVGASNVFRHYGKWLGGPVAVFDVTKGFAPALAGLLIGGEWVGVLAGAAAMLGHARPLFLGFSKGGKMVATAGGVTLALAPFAALACLVLWIALFATTRYASVASIITAAALPVACLSLGSGWPVVAFASVAFVSVVLLHRANIKRLLAGTEPRFRRTARA